MQTELQIDTKMKNLHFSQWKTICIDCFSCAIKGQNENNLILYDRPINRLVFAESEDFPMQL